MNGSFAGYASFELDKNSIMIVAHGVYDSKSDTFASSINIQTYNNKTEKWSDNYISNGKELNSFLSKNSETWKKALNGEISKDDLHIVFYSCGSAPVVQEMSKNEAFKDVTFVAPNKNVNVSKDAGIVKVADYAPNKTSIGEWVSICNGNISKTYVGDANLRPGTKNFKY